MTSSRAARDWTGAAGGAMALLCAVGPLELRVGTAAVFGLQFSAAELFGALALAVGAWAVLLQALRSDPEGAALRRNLRGAVPVAMLIWAAVHLLSVLHAPADRALVLKFGLRVTAGVLLGVVACLLGPHAVFRRRVATGVLLGLGGVTLVAAAERLAGQAMEPFLRLFRDEPTWMLGEQRLSAVFYHANTFAAYLELTVPFVLLLTARPGLSPQARGRWWVWLALGGAMLSLTYSRAGLLAAVLGALSLVMAARVTRPRPPLMKVAAIFAIGVSLAYLANPDMRARLGLEQREYRVDYQFFGRCNGHVGTTTRVPVTIVNRGEWAVSNRQAPGQLAHVFWSGEGRPEASDFRYQDMPELGPGEQVELQVEIQLPEEPGWITTLFDIRRKKVLWISSTGNALGRLRCLARPRGMDLDASYDPPTRVDASLLADPSFQRRPLELSRLHYWSAAGQLLAQRPWLGHGADRFRLAYRAYVPKRAWDPRARSHSVVIETAANLGLLGLAALGLLAGAVGASLFGVFRAGVSAGPLRLAAAAATLAFGLHSCVDYFLGYTQIYLVAWPIIGLACAPMTRPPAPADREETAHVQP